MTSLTTAVGGMKHWDWCPICRGGLDTGLECDQCGADLMPIYTAFKESLSGGNPGEPKACTPAEERGIVGATGAGQPPDGNPESTGDSAERRSPDGTELTPSPDESHRHPSSKSTVWMAKNRAYSETCYFGNYATAVAWARGGTVVPVEIQHYTSPALRVPRTDMLAEAVRMIQGYKRAGWLTNPAAGEQAIDFIARASHEPPQPAEATECRYCDEVMKERDDYHEWADTLAYDIERLVGVEIGEHSNLNSPWGNAHDAAEYELDKRARKPHEPLGALQISPTKETTMTTDAAIEQEIQAKGLTAPRITPAHIDAVCHKPAQFHVFPGTMLTVCCLELANGFTVTGESACASPENFNQEIGEKIAYANAKQKVWALEGYLLKQNLFNQGQA